MKRLKDVRLLASSALTGATLSIMLLPQPAAAQASSSSPEPAASRVDEVVVTGSRIRRATDTETTAPVTVVGQQELLERGATQVGDILNRVTSLTPMTPAAIGDGSAAGDGRQYPNLFNLGGGRTLTLVNGRRTAASSQGLEDRLVDTNAIPTGLIERVDVVQAGGAAVYGSDAIAGVVNYVLKDNFQGLTIDLQYGDSSRSDYRQPSVRVTAGTNFAEGRGNIAGNIEWSKTDPLPFGSRPITDPVIRTVSNPLNKSLTDGIPARTPVVDPHFWGFNDNGVLFSTGDDFAIANLLGFNSTGQQMNGFQFSSDGQRVVPYNAGTQYVAGFNCRYPFCQGGEGYPYNNLASLFSGVERYSIAAVGHYNLTDRMKLSGELIFGKTQGVDPLGTQGQSRLAEIKVSNPYLTPEARSALSALQPGFATGDASVWLGKELDDLLPTREYVYTTDTYRGVVALDGDFDLGERNYYYNAFYSRSVVKGKTNSYGTASDRLDNALDSALNGAGQIVCAINAVQVTDPNCAPLNPFGRNQVSAAARNYITYIADDTYTNTQDDFLVSLGGDLVKLPAGMAKFNVSYEHRKESAKFTPSAAEQAGISGTPFRPASGGFHTNEFAGEALVPVVGGDFTLPLVEAFELNGQYRFVNNSLAGKEKVWGVGARWEVGYGLTLRASRSRNFRAPNLNQLLGPRETHPLDEALLDPCDQRAVNTGPAAATRLANCQALFAANPSYGPLADFQTPVFNGVGGITTITSGGNPELRNEISKTTTFGLIWQPTYIPGSLTFVADRVIVDLKDGITPFGPSDFAQACFDASPQPTEICSTFTRDSQGNIIAALDTVFNAAAVRYRGEVYSLNYRFPASWILPMFEDPGELEINLEATHNDSLKTIVAGVTTPMAGTVQSPRWVMRDEVRYRRGPLTLSYELYYRPRARVSLFDNIESTPFPRLKANARHSISGAYEFSDHYVVRAGVNNLTDRGPSFPSYSYGDILGRQWFVGLQARF